MDAQNNNLIAAAQAVKEFKLHGKNFVSGLYWHAISDMRKRQTELKNIIKKEGYAAVVERTSATPQAGFCAAAVKKGTYSVAACLAGLLGNSWIGIFEVEKDLYILTAVNDGAIIPGSDIGGTRDQVLMQFEHLNSLLLFEKIYAPENLGVGGEILSLLQVLSPKRLRNDYKMRVLKVKLERQHYLLAIILIVATTLITYGYGRYKIYRNLKETERQLELEKQAGLSKAAGSLAGTLEEKKVWEFQANPQNTIKRCVQEMNKIPISLGGWGFQNATCNDSTVVVNFKRMFNATAETFEQAIKQQNLDIKPTFNQQYEEVQWTIELAKVTPQKGDQLLPKEELEKTVYTFFQKRQLPFTWTDAGVAIAEAGIHSYELTLSLDRNPTELFKDINWPGFRINEVKTEINGAQLHWSVKGTVYVK